MAVTIDVVEMLGEEMRVMFPVAARSGAVFGSVPQAAETAGEVSDPAAADDVVATAGSTTFTASLTPDLSITPGARLELAVDTGGLYFFDSETGRALRPGTDGDCGAETVARRSTHERGARDGGRRVDG